MVCDVNNTVLGRYMTTGFVVGRSGLFMSARFAATQKVVWLQNIQIALDAFQEAGLHVEVSWPNLLIHNLMNM